MVSSRPAGVNVAKRSNMLGTKASTAPKEKSIASVPICETSADLYTLVCSEQSA